MNNVFPRDTTHHGDTTLVNEEVYSRPLPKVDTPMMKLTYNTPKSEPCHSGSEILVHVMVVELTLSMYVYNMLYARHNRNPCYGMYNLPPPCVCCHGPPAPWRGPNTHTHTHTYMRIYTHMHTGRERASERDY